jgi:hypothetical protein
MVRELSVRDRAAEKATSPLISRLGLAVLKVAETGFREQFARKLEELKTRQ